MIEPPIFDYLDLVARHRYGAQGASRTPRPLDADRRRLVDFQRSLDGITGASCWTGVCPGCGRNLVSATTHLELASDAYYCTRACRAEHGAG